MLHPLLIIRDPAKKTYCKNLLQRSAKKTYRSRINKDVKVKAKKDFTTKKLSGMEQSVVW